jgi:PIN domain nuclease of toxin-antitoxin system
MKYLLDTHIFLWMITDDPRLSTPVKKILLHPESGLYLSYASIWEMTIKCTRGNLRLPSPVVPCIIRQCFLNFIPLLPIDVVHFDQLSVLADHHRDPFDRLLIAQSIAERLPTLSADAIFDLHGVQRVW